MGRVATLAALIAATAAARTDAQTLPPPLPAEQAVARGVGDVTLSPRRLVLTPRRRAGVFVVFNRGTAPASYRVAVHDLVMTGSGDLIEGQNASSEAKAAMHSALDLLRVSPRAFQIEPGRSQVVRVLAEPPTDAQPAVEYHTHVTVSAVPPPAAGFDVAEATRTARGPIQIRIVPVFGVSIPVVVRTQASPPAASWQGVTITRSAKGLQLQAQLVRGSPNSVYGVVEVRAADKASGDPLAHLDGVSVYTEVPSRTVQLTLPASENDAPPGRTYRLTYQDGEVEDGKVLAETQVRAP